MLKQLRLVGFETRPDLKAHFERMLSDAERELGRWSHRVEVVIELNHPASDRPFVWLTLSLRLPHLVGEDSAVAAYADVEQPQAFRKWVRFVWGNVLDKLLDQIATRFEQERTAPRSEMEVAESQGV